MRNKRRKINKIRIQREIKVMDSGNFKVEVQVRIKEILFWNRIKNRKISKSRSRRNSLNKQNKFWN